MKPKKILPTIKRVWRIDDNEFHEEMLIAPPRLGVNEAEAEITKVRREFYKQRHKHATAYDLSIWLQRDHSWLPFEFELYDFDDHEDTNE